jgi:hypothetical protein
MVAPDSRAYRAHRQAETPLSVLCRIPAPPLRNHRIRLLIDYYFVLLPTTILVKGKAHEEGSSCFLGRRAHDHDSNHSPDTG